MKVMLTEKAEKRRTHSFSICCSEQFSLPEYNLAESFSVRALGVPIGVASKTISFCTLDFSKVTRCAPLGVETDEI